MDITTEAGALFDSPSRLKNRALLLDITIVNPCAGSNLGNAARHVGKHLADAVERKKNKYRGSFPATYSLLPLAMCLDVGACLKVNTRSLGRGALHKKYYSIPLLLTSERHAGRACSQLFARSVLTIQCPNHIYTKPLLPNDSPASRTEYPKQPLCSVRDSISETLRDCQVKRQQLQFQQISSN